MRNNMTTPGRNDYDKWQENYNLVMKRKMYFSPGCMKGNNSHVLLIASQMTIVRPVTTLISSAWICVQVTVHFIENWGLMKFSFKTYSMRRENLKAKYSVECIQPLGTSL